MILFSRSECKFVQGVIFAIVMAFPSFVWADEREDFLKETVARIDRRADEAYSKAVKRLERMALEETARDAMIKKVGSDISSVAESLKADVVRQLSGDSDAEFERKRELIFGVVQKVFDSDLSPKWAVKKVASAGFCDQCGKRATLSFHCRCGGDYCVKHREDIHHECGFDFKSFERDLIRKKNPKVESSKVSPI